MNAQQTRRALLALTLPTLLAVSACDVETTTFMVGTLERDRIELTRAGLLRVDGLLPAFFEPEHQGIRYT